MGHHHSKVESRIGFFDVILGLIIFIGLWALVSKVAGPEGVGFLKGRLDELHSSEMLISGVLLLLLWAILGPLVMEPYLKTIYDREARTSGMASENLELKKEVEKLKSDLAAEVKTARLEGVRRRDEKVAAAKKQASEIVDAGKKIAEEEWQVFEKEIADLRIGLFSSIDNEISSLSSEVFKKILPSEISSKYLH